MDIRHHITAFQAQWIIKYLDPRRSPWKDALDHWIIRDDDLGRGSILSSDSTDPAARLPEECEYMRACFASFAKIKITQDTDLIPEAVEGEPFWKNNRFTVNPVLGPGTAQEWIEDLHTARLSDLLHSNGFLSSNDWDQYITQQAPRHLSSQQKRRWIHEKQLDLPLLKPSIPRDVRTALKTPLTIQDGDIVFATDAHQNVTCAKFVTTHIEELWLDTSNYPHPTGRTIPLANLALTKAALWTHLNKHYFQPYAGEEEMADATPELTSVIGPMTTAFPLNEGWYMQGQQVTQDPEHPMRLSDLTIHEITVNLTDRDTKDVRPNCEANWVRDSKTGRPR